MKKIFLILVVLATADKSWAISYCSTYGNHTYCDDGASYHRYGKVITELDATGKPQNRYRTFDGATYGNGREWVKQESDGDYTSYGLKGKTRQVLPDILDRSGDDGSDGDSGGDE
jgi:hypothetical protein